LQVRLPNHGGLTVRRSCKRAFVYCTSRSFAGESPHRRTTKSGGRKPPWHANILVRQETLGAAGAVTDPRRAGTRRSCRTCVCAPRMSLFFSGPASCTRSGWRQPAVVVKRFAPAKRHRTFATIRVRPSRAAGVSQPWGTIRSCVVNVITPRKPIAIAGAIPVPRRANARRSRERAFVHRECRYFSGDRRRAPGAIRVSQPWGTIRSCVVNVITSRKPIAIAGAVTDPPRADARRSWKTCVCAPRMSLFFRRPASCTRSG
jgi:hypothetical protein